MMSERGMPRLWDLIFWSTFEQEKLDNCDKLVSMKLPLSVIALATSSSSSPELPMHVVQPYPIKLKPRLSKYFCKPLILRQVRFSWFEAKKIAALKLPGRREILPFLQIFGHCSRSWSKTSFNPWMNLSVDQSYQRHAILRCKAMKPHLKAKLTRLLCNKASTKHDTWVRGVCATCYGSNNNATMSNLCRLPMEGELHSFILLLFRYTKALQ